jgi:hypothetical protein
MTVRGANRIFAISFFICLVAPFILGAYSWLNAPVKHADINAVSLPEKQQEQKPVTVLVPAVR